MIPAGPRRDPSAETVFRALGGFRTARGYLCRCPVPLHGQGRGDRNPSLFVSDGERRLVLTCFAGCSWHDIAAALDSRNLSEEAAPPRREPPPPKTTTADAAALWREALPVEGTLAARYVDARGLPPPPPSLRFLPDAPYSSRRLMPALVAGMQDVERQLVAVQLTFLHPSRPEKAGVKRPRRIIGPARGAALRLAAPAEILGMAEGYENGHAAMMLHGLPTWCCLGAERMALVRLPPIVRRLVIFADPDAPGLRAAEATRAAHPRLSVEIRPPPGMSGGAKDRDDYAEHYRRLGLAGASTLKSMDEGADSEIDTGAGLGRHAL